MIKQSPFGFVPWWRGWFYTTGRSMLQGGLSQQCVAVFWTVVQQANNGRIHSVVSHPHVITHNASIIHTIKFLNPSTNAQPPA